MIASWKSGCYISYPPRDACSSRTSCTSTTVVPPVTLPSSNLIPGNLCSFELLLISGSPPPPVLAIRIKCGRGEGRQRTPGSPPLHSHMSHFNVKHVTVSVGSLSSAEVHESATILVTPEVPSILLALKLHAHRSGHLSLLSVPQLGCGIMDSAVSIQANPLPRHTHWSVDQHCVRPFSLSMLTISRTLGPSV
jgi:hypothetical protein